MAKFSEEYNKKGIKEMLENKELSQEQAKIMKNFAQHLKEKNFTIETQRLKLFHLQKFYKQIGKDFSLLSPKEKEKHLQDIKFNDMKDTIEYFYKWYEGNTIMQSYEGNMKDIRQRRINSLLKRKGLSKEQKRLMRRFYENLQRKGLRKESQRAYLQNLYLLLKQMKKLPNEWKQKDIDTYLTEINRKYKAKTIKERRLFLIYFSEWFFDKPKEKISFIKDLKIERSNGTKLPEEILSPEEIKKMVQVTDNFRDKAIIMLLYETGARKGEFLKLKIKHLDITNKEYGMITIPMGKTTSRKIPIIFSLPHIQELLNSHPRRDNPNAPLFVNYGAWLGRALGQDGLKRLVKILGKRAGIKKNIYPHLFRHSRLTELAKELTEQELKKFAGWTPNSNMASVYVHLSGKDVSNKILANAGIINEDNAENGRDTLKSIKCPRCNKINSAETKYCSCGFCLDLKEMNKIIEKKKIGEEELNKFIENEPIQKLFKMVYKLQKQMEELKKGVV